MLGYPGEGSHKEIRMNGIVIRTMKKTDIAVAISLWKRTPGVGLTESDTPAGVSRYLKRNPGMSLAAMQGKRLVAAVLCGHDGRRGYLGHLAVDEDFRKAGVGSELVGRCLKALKKAGIRRCAIMVYKKNRSGLEF